MSDDTNIECQTCRAAHGEVESVAPSHERARREEAWLLCLVLLSLIGWGGAAFLLLRAAW